MSDVTEMRDCVDDAYDELQDRLPGRALVIIASAADGSGEGGDNSYFTSNIDAPLLISLLEEVIEVIKRETGEHSAPYANQIIN